MLRSSKKLEEQLDWTEAKKNFENMQVMACLMY